MPRQSTDVLFHLAGSQIDCKGEFLIHGVCYIVLSFKSMILELFSLAFCRSVLCFRPYFQ